MGSEMCIRDSIRGVDYIDTKLLEGTEHEHLIKEIEELQLLTPGEMKNREEIQNKLALKNPETEKLEKSS